MGLSVELSVTLFVSACICEMNRSLLVLLPWHVSALEHGEVRVQSLYYMLCENTLSLILTAHVGLYSAILHGIVMTNHATDSGWSSAIIVVTGHRASETQGTDSQVIAAPAWRLTQVRLEPIPLSNPGALSPEMLLPSDQLLIIHLISIATEV